MTLRVGTYNCLDGGGTRWSQQMKVLKALEYDVLGIQEAKYWNHDGFARMLATARMLGMQPLFAPSASHGCHLITLFRWPRVQCIEFDPDMGCGTMVDRIELPAHPRTSTIARTSLRP